MSRLYKSAFYHSINVQAICQPDGMFSDVLARFPGSVHDSRICKIPGVRMHVENTFSIGKHILGDSGYMMRPYLLTPYRQPISTPQSNYNYAHKRQGLLLNRHLDDGNKDSTVFMGSSG